MDTLTINKTRFVVIEQKQFDKIQLAAAQKTPVVKKLSLSLLGESMPLNSLINGKKESKYPGTCCHRCR